MRQRGDHPTERGKPLVTGQLVLQAAGFGKVGEQHQLARLPIERTRCDGQPPAILERHFVAIVLARREAANDHLAPEHPDQRLAEQLPGNRIGFADQALAVDHHDPAGKQVEQALQTLRQALLLRQLLHALGADQFQFAGELIDAGLQRSVGVAEPFRHLLEQRIRPAEFIGGAIARRNGFDGGALGDWLHVNLSRGDRQRTVVLRDE